MLVVVALLVTVLICIFSVMPREGFVDPNNADDIRTHMAWVAAYKVRTLRLAKWAVVISLVIAVLGLLVTGTKLDAIVGVVSTIGLV